MPQLSDSSTVSDRYWIVVGLRSVKIRSATASDVTGILESLRSAFAPYRRQYTARAYAATVLTPSMALRRLRSMTVLVATARGGRIVGTVAVKWTSSGHAHLRGMAVLPAYQGKGIASALLKAAVRRARADGRTRVTLETTEPLRRATRFYLLHGFRFTGRYRHWGGMKLVGLERTLPAASHPGLRGERRPVLPRGRWDRQLGRGGGAGVLGPYPFAGRPLR